MNELWAKIKEALISALPITLIVYFMALLPWFNFSRMEMITFTIGAVLLILGIGLFSLGADVAMTPMGAHMGAGLSRQKKLGLLLGVCFVLGLNIHKAVLFSVIREDMADPIMKCLEEKFATIRNGKGIAFAVPLSSVIGVNMYQFLSNNKQGRED